MFNIKKRLTVASLIVLILVSVIYSQAQATEFITAKGTVKGFANPKQSKTISVDIDNRGVTVFKYSDKTVFRNFRSLPELKNETISITYRVEGADRIAAMIIKSLVRIPNGVTVINTAEMAELVRKGPVAANYYLIDSRPSKRYEEGHLPGAVSIPVSKMNKNPDLLLSNKNVPLIFYGGGPTCGMSPRAAELAQKWEYKNIRIYLPGEPAWTKAGNYTISTVEFVRDGNVVLIDLRTPQDVQAGHIPGAVNIPADKLHDARRKFPAYKGADIVFYSDDVDDLISAVKTAHTWGYRKSTIFLGGTGAWELMGYDLTQGPASETIAYERIIPEGEISIKDFETALRSSDALIVDVRNASEYAAGHIRGSSNMPVDTITSRQSELSKEKMILTYCVTGVRAEMAYSILKEQGYSVKFLNAAPVFNADGSYRISE